MSRFLWALCLLALKLPLLKKPDTDLLFLNNCRPISNLTFMSELLERPVANQLNAHLTNNSL